MSNASNASQDTATIYICEGVASMLLHIPTRGETTTETKAFTAAVKALGGQRAVKFRNIPGTARRCSVAVSDPAVATAIRLVAKRSRHDIHADTRLLRVRCPYCDFTTESNTDADQRKLAHHLAEDCPGQTAVDDTDGGA